VTLGRNISSISSIAVLVDAVACSITSAWEDRTVLRLAVGPVGHAITIIVFGIAADTVLVDAITWCVRRSGEDAWVGVVAVTLVRCLAVAIIVLSIGVICVWSRVVIAVTIRINPVARCLGSAGANAGVVVVAIAIDSLKTITIVVGDASVASITVLIDAILRNVSSIGIDVGVGVVAVASGRREAIAIEIETSSATTTSRSQSSTTETLVWSYKF